MDTREETRSELERVGRAIAGARAKAGLTQADVAKAACIAPSNISKLETAKSAARLDTLTRVARAVGLTIKLEPAA